MYVVYYYIFITHCECNKYVADVVMLHWCLRCECN